MHRHVFVYGTLRPCDARWAEDGEVAPPQAGTTAGALYDYGGFPYADFDGNGTVTGDILTMDDEHEAFEHVRRVELGAGYVEREVPVTLGNGQVLICLTYDASPEVKERRLPRLPRVPGDDWYNVVKMTREERYEYRRSNREMMGVFI